MYVCVAVSPYFVEDATVKAVARESVTGALVRRVDVAVCPPLAVAVAVATRPTGSQSTELY